MADREQKTRRTNNPTCEEKERPMKARRKVTNTAETDKVCNHPDKGRTHRRKMMAAGKADVMASKVEASKAREGKAREGKVSSSKVEASKVEAAETKAAEPKATKMEVSEPKATKTKAVKAGMTKTETRESRVAEAGKKRAAGTSEKGVKCSFFSKICNFLHKTVKKWAKNVSESLLCKIGKRNEQK